MTEETKIDTMQEITVRSTLDGTMQPSLFYCASETDSRPLLVGLHSWSWDRTGCVEGMLPVARRLGWHLLLPDFRGPNCPTNPEPTKACGSPFAKQDILDAIDYVEERYPIDRDCIFLCGGSGGGHMALLMAGYAPTRFRAISSFVPLTDVEAWYHEKHNNPVGGKYAEDIVAVCGGEPSPATIEEYRYRSPMTYIDEIARSNTEIYTGVFDHSIPCHHGFDLYTAVHAKYPDARVFLRMFDGGHDIRYDWMEEWFLSQMPDTRNKGEQVSG